MHSFALPQITRDRIDALIWACGLLLQLTLFIALFRRALAQRVPLFTGLIGFYLLRSAVLYLGFGPIGSESYHSIYETSQMLEIFIELGLAASLALTIIRGEAGALTQPERRMRAMAAAALVMGAVLLTWLVASVVPARAMVRPDRAQILFDLLMILLWGWSRILRSPLEPARTILSGFAVYGTIGIAASLGRAHASLSHSAREYGLWSYAASASYLVVVIYWIISIVQARAQSIDQASTGIQLTGDVS